MRGSGAVLLAGAALLAAAAGGSGILPAPALAAGDRKPDLPALVKFLASLQKKREPGKKDAEEIAKRLEGLSAEDLSWFLDRLRETPEKERGAAAPAVEARVEEALLAARWGAGIVRLPDAAKRIADPSDAARDALLADASRLEDPEPGTRLSLWALEGGSLRVRLRAVDALGDLLSWGGDAARIVPALVKSLADPSAAVRDLALERLADAGDGAALDGALELCGLPAEEEAEVRGVREKRCPGDRALELLTRASRIRFGLDPEGFRALEEGERKALLDEFRAWRAKAGGAALRNGEEGPFDPIPKVTTAFVDGRTADAASVRWWSEVDRAQFRLDLEELKVVASSKLDWVAGFRLTVVASGARQGNWEAFARKLRCGARHRLPRKGFGLVETSIQPLLDGRWRVRVFAYESR